MTSRQSRLRERRKAEGWRPITVILTPSGDRALEEFSALNPDMTRDHLVSFALMAAVYLHKRQISQV